MSNLDHSVQHLLTFDESRLVRLFRCLNSLERSVFLHELHLKLMKTHTVLPELERYAKWKEHEVEEMLSDVNERLESARPHQTEIANANDLTSCLSEMA